MRTLTARRAAAEHRRTGLRGRVKLDLPYVKAYRSKGKTYAYYRRGKSRLPIKGVPGSVAWMEEYRRIHASFGAEPEQAVPGSLKAVAIEYKRSSEFAKKLRASTQRSYRRYLDALCLRYGDLPVATFPRAAAVEIRENLSDTPRTANYTIQVLSALLTFAVDREYRESNPLVGTRFKMLSTGPGHRPWEEFEVERFQKHWPAGALERVAFELMLNTGQRGQDVRLMARQHFHRGQLSVKQLKTDERLWIPASQELSTILSPWLESRPGALIVLASTLGKEYTASGFGHLMRDAYRAASLPADCTSHGLRYTAATRLKELGCEDETIAAITGHGTMQMVRKYTEQKRRARLAVAALDGRSR